MDDIIILSEENSELAPRLTPYEEKCLELNYKILKRVNDNLNNIKNLKSQRGDHWPEIVTDEVYAFAMWFYQEGFKEGEKYAMEKGSVSK